MSAGPEYKTYESLAQRLRIKKRVDNLVCLDCGVLVVDKEAHDRLHSITSSWAWAIAIIKTRHATEEIHNRYDIIPRIDSKRFGNNSADALAAIERDNKKENEGK